MSKRSNKIFLFPVAKQRISSPLAGMMNGAVPLFAALFASMLLRRVRNQREAPPNTPSGIVASNDHAGRLGRRDARVGSDLLPTGGGDVLGLSSGTNPRSPSHSRERPWSWREHGSRAARKRAPPFLPRPNLCEAGLGDTGRAPCPPRICLCLLCFSRRFYGSVNSCVCGLRWPSRTAPAVVFPLSR
jgi:hypothetical protein